MGFRLLGRLGVKGGLGTHTFVDDEDYIFRFNIVIPLGKAIDQHQGVFLMGLVRHSGKKDASQ